MAFIDQVQDLTSLTVSDNDELSQFLKDGVIDVTNRWISIKPQDIEDFVRGSSTQSSNGFATSGADIVSVIREAGADGDTDGSTAWEPCRKVSSSMRSRVVDVDSLSYASKYNPVYIINNNSAVNVYPVPDGTNDGYRVYYVNNDPKGDGIVDELAAGHSTIGYFPKNKVYLVVMYAGIKLIHATLAAKSVPSVPVSQVLPTLNITATDPTAISLTTISYLPITASTSTALTSLTAPTYTKPTLVLGTAPTISNLSLTAVPPDSPTLDEVTFSSIDSAVDATLVATATSTTLGGSTTPPEYSPPTQTFDIAQFETFLETEEDAELAQVQMARLQHELGEFQADIQNELNEFNKENVAYQSSVQEAMAEFQSSNQIAISNAERSQNRQLQNSINDMQVIIQNNQKLINKYQAELGVYQAEVSAQVQEYQQNLAGDIQVWQGERSTDLQKYGSDIQNELNKFNKENASFGYEVQKALADSQAANQVALQNGVQQARDAIENNNAQVQRFQSMAQHYAAQVNEDIQKYTVQVQGLTADIQASVSKHGAELQGTQAEYQWLQDQYTRLKGEYDQAFMMAAPKQQAAPQAARQRR